jgi:hypothetical protein
MRAVPRTFRARMTGANRGCMVVSRCREASGRRIFTVTPPGYDRFKLGDL